MAILTINSGSSSLKFGLYADDGQTLLLEGKAEEIGHPSSKLTLTDSAGAELGQEQAPLDSQQTALAAASRALSKHSSQPVAAIGHRIVHGGPDLRQHCAITPEVLRTLEASVHFAPLHIPPAVALVRATGQQFPGVPQFACFDTQFHTTMPPEAYTYPLPKPYREAGVRRYGFHGLSYESIVRLLAHNLPQKLVVAHLGSGSSICAIANGSSVDTSMGISPTGGVPMATRPGDLDPSLVLLLQRRLSPDLPGLTPDKIEDLLNHGSGLQALAGESDIRSLIQRAHSSDQSSDQSGAQAKVGDATLALAIFARSVAKTIASYATVLDGIDLLVFTGGIGEHSDPVRRQICGALRVLGLELLPPGQSSQGQGSQGQGFQGGIISHPSSRVQVRVVPTDEDGEIARHVKHLLQKHLLQDTSARP